MNKKNTLQKSLPIGISDFKKIRENSYYYIDKTALIRNLTDSATQVTLLPRPRRFGKTLNMSMLRYFFEKSEEDRSGLFEGTEIFETDVFHTHQGRYPVIFLSFKDLKDSRWESMLDGMIHIIQDAFSYHGELSESETLSEDEKAYFRSVSSGECSLRAYTDSLRYLSAFLSRHYQEQTVILIDEYDTPVHAAWAEGYYKEAVSFLSGGLKDNPHLYKGVLTGILRIARESVFSDLNNLKVHSLLSSAYSTAFGFTESEVRKMLADCGIPEAFDTVSRWYNGYLFGGNVIYNPWSVLNYADDRPETPRPYWNNTASTEMIEEPATRSGRELREEIGLLLEGAAIEKPVYENIVMKDLEKRDDLLWSFLLFSGYLKPVRQIDYEKWTLAIPNQEVRIIYEGLVRNWFADRVTSDRTELLLRSLREGDVGRFEILLSDIVETVLSSHDTGGPEPEKFYHAFVLGLLVWMEKEYDIRSNRESGLGRYDVMLNPKDKCRCGVIMEFKKVDSRRKETPEQTLEKAATQMKKKRYAAELEASGVGKILKLAIAFRGKELWVAQR